VPWLGVGKAPPWREITLSGLTGSGMSGKITLPKIDPLALPDVLPASLWSGRFRFWVVILLNPNQRAFRTRSGAKSNGFA